MDEVFAYIILERLRYFDRYVKNPTVYNIREMGYMIHAIPITTVVHLGILLGTGSAHIQYHRTFYRGKIYTGKDNDNYFLNSLKEHGDKKEIDKIYNECLKEMSIKYDDTNIKSYMKHFENALNKTDNFIDFYNEARIFLDKNNYSKLICEIWNYHDKPIINMTPILQKKLGSSIINNNIEHISKQYAKYKEEGYGRLVFAFRQFYLEKRNYLLLKYLFKNLVYFGKLLGCVNYMGIIVDYLIDE